MFHACITYIAVLPKPRRTDMSVPRTSMEKQPSDNLGDYSTLNPASDEGDESLPTGDSGFEEAQQWSQQGKIFCMNIIMNIYIPSTSRVKRTITKNVPSASFFVLFNKTLEKQRS